MEHHAAAVSSVFSSEGVRVVGWTGSEGMKDDCILLMLGLLFSCISILDIFGMGYHVFRISVS